MTKQQKARAHLARAQQILQGHGTVAFGGVSHWSNDTRERKEFGGGPSTLPIEMDDAPNDYNERYLDPQPEGGESRMTPHCALVETARDLNGQGLLNFREIGRDYKDAVSTLMQERTRGDQGEKNLNAAIQNKDSVMVRLLLQNGARMKTSLIGRNTPHDVLVEIARDWNGQDLLDFRAIGRPYKDAVSTLMQERTRGDQGEKNLMDAFKKADIVMVMLLLQNGARMETLELLRHAISYNIEDLAIKIIFTQLSTDSLDTDKIHIDHEIVTDQTALMYAISHGRYDIAKLLVDRGADVNGKNFRFDGISSAMELKTPLDWACRRVILDKNPDRLPFVEYLLKKSANPRMMGKYRFLLRDLTEDPQASPDERDLSALLRSYPGNQV